MSIYAKDVPELGPASAHFTHAYKAFDIGPGWVPIVVELDRQLNEIDPDYKLHQVKEKFGGLRVYATTLPEGYKLIEVAERIASETCDTCSKPGKLISDNGWYHVGCDNH